MGHDFSTHNLAFGTPWISIYEEDTWYALASPSGGHGGAALVIDVDHNVLLAEIYRHPIDRTVLEIPRGGFDPRRDTAPLDTALREAREELGVDLSGATIVDLGILHPDDGILSYENRLCAALLPGRFDRIEIDTREVEGYRVLPLGEVSSMILSGEINDAHTIAAVFRLGAALPEIAGP